MKTIFVLRHAKTEKLGFKNISNDFDRPLMPFGIDQCQKICDYLKKSTQKIDLVIASPALRTKQTAELSIAGLAHIPKIEFIPHLYNAKSDTILKTIEKLDDSISTIIVVGHNPGIHEFAIKISSAGESELIRNIVEDYSPGTMARVEFPDLLTWNKLKNTNGKLLDLLVTK